MRYLLMTLSRYTIVIYEEFLIKLPNRMYINCDPAWAYAHKIHLFILQYIYMYVYISFTVLEICNCKLHKIPYEKLHKWCKFY